MAKEIERKFLVDVAAWTPSGPGTAFQQGYLSSHADRVVRVRLEGSAAKLTIKGKNIGVTRSEYEYTIPPGDAQELLATLCERPLIEKQRHVETYDGKTWEIDVFGGANAGLVIAEIELASETETFSIPPWAIREVSHDARYYNSNLVKTPFTSWPQGAKPDAR